MSEAVELWSIKSQTQLKQANNFNLEHSKFFKIKKYNCLVKKSVYGHPTLNCQKFCLEST